MTELGRGRLAVKYITFELLPVFLMGMSVFIFVLIMAQSFKLSEFVIVHGAKSATMARLVFYMMLGYLPILFPVSLLFAVLLVYGRLSNDSEIVALKALGLAPSHIVAPALIIGVLISALSLQTSFRLAPWGHKKLDEIINVLSQTKPGASLREGVFSQGFFDLVIYANKVNSNEGLLKKIFIFDERDANSPITIIAKEGKLLNTKNESGNEAYLRLIDGNMHKTSSDSYTKIDFDTYDINLFDPHEIREGNIAPNTLNMQELRAAISNTKNTPKEKTNLIMEWNRRWSLSITCLIFAFLGVSLGAVTNRRTARSGSLVICISAIVLYWTLHVSFESLARAGHFPIQFSSWMANIIALGIALHQFRRVTES